MKCSSMAFATGNPSEAYKWVPICSGIMSLGQKGFGKAVSMTTSVQQCYCFYFRLHGKGVESRSRTSFLQHNENWGRGGQPQKEIMRFGLPGFGFLFGLLTWLVS